MDKVSTSGPSVALSKAIGISTVVVPFALDPTVTVPLSEPLVISVLETPESVKGNTVPPATSVVASTKLAVPPSLTLEKVLLKRYVGVGETEVSLITIDAELFCTESVMVSLPSSSLSAVIGINIVDCPLLSTVVTPVKDPLVTSVAEIPDKV